MTNKYRGVWAAGLRECPVCFAAVTDPQAHTEWHNRVRQAVAGETPIVDPVDEDQ
jgi:hypothetical protein